MDTHVPPRPRTSLTRAALALTGAAALFAAGAAPAAAAACEGADAAAGAPQETVRSATLCLINKRRRAHGLRRLRGQRDLREAAQRYAQDMVSRGFFSHVAPGGVDLQDRLRASGFIQPSEAWFVGENLAWGEGSQGSPRSIVRMWMASPGHRANILQPRFRHVGIGVAAGAPQPVGGAATTYATNFGD